MNTEANGEEENEDEKLHDYGREGFLKMHAAMVRVFENAAAMSFRGIVSYGYVWIGGMSFYCLDILKMDGMEWNLVGSIPSHSILYTHFSSPSI